MNVRTRAMLAFGLVVVAPAMASPLPALKLDRARTTVSGLSSGAYMAHQAHVAYSDHVAGAALIAGGPYHCAQAALETALASCMMPAQGKGPDVAALATFARDAAKAGRIAPLSGLAGDRVLVLHGRADKTVAESLSADTAAIYRALAAGARKPLTVQEELGGNWTHTFPTLDAGAACDTATAPYVGKCGYDAAGAIFAYLYGEPAHPVAADATGELRTFDQRIYRVDDVDAHLAASGYIYVPKACAAGARCALHIAFHGCQQNAETAGEAFVRDAGYNRWADAYDAVVLYPQAQATMAPLNPKGCWDWWGYGGEAYDTRDGAQLRQVAAMAAALGAPLR